LRYTTTLHNSFTNINHSTYKLSTDDLIHTIFLNINKRFLHLQTKQQST